MHITNLPVFMNSASLIRLVALSAIWGASFIFMRMAVPVLGPVVLIEARLLLAAGLLFLVGLILKQRLKLGLHWRHYLVLGLFNSALPFLLFAFAAKTLSASLLSILNATAPIWGTVIGAVWRRSPLRGKTAFGLTLGVAGVVLLVGFDRVTLQPGAGWAIVAALAAAFCYGIASNYAKSASAASSQDPYANAHGSMWAAALLLAPALPFFPAATAPALSVLGAVVALGVFCTGIAYLLYFRLVADLGAGPALTVTFLIPVFGILWGHLFLGEAIGWHTLAGAVVVLLGTALVTGFSLRAVWAPRAVSHG